LYQGLVKDRGQLVNLQGGLNWPLGDAWDFDGPTLFVLFGLYKPQFEVEAVIAGIDAEIAGVVRKGVTPAALERVKTKMLSDYYGNLEQFLQRADTLAKLQALWGDAGVVNSIPDRIAAVSGAEVQRVAAWPPEPSHEARESDLAAAARLMCRHTST
jgi:predicted Zn-dependent peptidase